MKRKEILALPPGERLDALVAEKVTGWLQPPGIFRPSTNVTAALEVVEKIKRLTAKSRYGSDCGHFSIDWPARDDYCNDTELWAAGWHDYACGERIASVEAHAETLPLAICRAALLTVAEPAGEDEWDDD